MNMINVQVQSTLNIDISNPLLITILYVVIKWTNAINLSHISVILSIKQRFSKKGQGAPNDNSFGLRTEVLCAIWRGAIQYNMWRVIV